MRASRSGNPDLEALKIRVTERATALTGYWGSIRGLGFWAFGVQGLRVKGESVTFRSAEHGYLLGDPTESLRATLRSQVLWSSAHVFPGTQRA